MEAELRVRVVRVGDGHRIDGQTDVVWKDTHVVGRVNASFGGDSDFWPLDTGPYIEVMDEVLGG